MTYKVKLSKISKNENRLRTNEVEGQCEELPGVGQSFQMTAQGIEFGTRWVCTSLVKALSEEASTDGSIVFVTENSEYRLDILP